MRAVKSVSIDSERRVIITFLDGSTETLYPNCIWCDSEALRQLIKDLLEEKADAITQTIENVTIATFADGADEALIKKLLVGIEPIQEGTGDPSPENVRPISGRTGLSVVRNGKNLLPNNAQTVTKGGLTFTVNADGSIHIVGTGTGAVANRKIDLPVSLKDGETYTASGINSVSTDCRIYLQDASGNATPSSYFSSGEKIFTKSASNNVGMYRIWVAENATVDTVIYPMIRLASVTDATYEPYHSKTVSVNWETEAGTVYSGSLDVVSGKLLVNGVKCIMGGGNISSISSWYSVDVNNQSWGFYLNKGDPIKQIISDDIIGKYLVSNKIKRNDTPYGNQPAWTGGITLTSDSTFNYLGIRIAKDALPEVSSASELVSAAVSYLNANPIEFVFQIAPTEIQLSPQEITTLLGANNIWADSGDILELEYVADTKLYIDESQSGTLGSERQTISSPDIQPVSEKTWEDLREDGEKKTQEETEVERGE